MLILHQFVHLVHVVDSLLDLDTVLLDEVHDFLDDRGLSAKVPVQAVLILHDKRPPP